MPLLSRLRALSLAMLVVLTPAAHAQSSCPPEDMALPASWTDAYPAYRVIGNLYVVGPDDLSVFLITTPEGHILINTGLADSTALIKANIEQLGFRFEDIKLLLVMQSHFDHAAALAEIKTLTGAQMLATRKDAPILEDGGAGDPHFGECTALRFEPVTVDRIIDHGEILTLGDTRLTVHEHPGHTEGSSSYSMTVREGKRDYRVGIVNMGSINAGKQLTVTPTYAGVAEDFADTFRKQRDMKPHIWVAAHASQFGREDKYEPGQPYSPETFLDPNGFLQAVGTYEQAYQEQLAAEASTGEEQ